jgi:hypothetical protein
MHAPLPLPPSPCPAVESSPPLDKDAPLCSKSLSITRSFCLATDWATRSPLAYKAGTLATKADPLTSFLAAHARWAGCGTNYGICAAAISAASAPDASDAVAGDATKAGALFSSFGLAPSLALQGSAGGNLTAGVLMEVCPPSPRTSLYNVSRVLAAAVPGRRCSGVVLTRCGAVGLGFFRVDRTSSINFTRVSSRWGSGGLEYIHACWDPLASVCAKGYPGQRTKVLFSRCSPQGPRSCMWPSHTTRPASTTVGPLLLPHPASYSPYLVTTTTPRVSGAGLSSDFTDDVK